MLKRTERRNKALTLTIANLIFLEAHSLSGGTSYKAAFVFYSIFLGVQTDCCCSKYCSGNPTPQFKNSENY